MNALIIIGLLGIFSYLNAHYAKIFKGSSVTVRSVCHILSYIGFLSFLLFVIWSFFQYPWWQPISAALVSMLLGGFVSRLFPDSLIMKLVSMIAVPVFFVLSLMALLNGNSDTVYICTGSLSKTYHRADDCMGLSRCSREIKTVSLDEAKEMGRRECRICY